MLMLEIFRSNRQNQRYQLHAFVIMPDHLHLLLTPAPDISLEKAMQYIKGGFSFRLKIAGEVWQRSFTEHRIKNTADYENHLAYIVENPARARLAAAASLYPYSSVALPDDVDPRPEQFVKTRG